MSGTTYIGLAIGDSMFDLNAAISRRPLSVEEVRQLSKTAVSCCNASHANTLAALQAKHSIEISTVGAPKVSLRVGDSIIVLSVRGLPRLEGTAQYNDEQIANATFAFGIWTVNA